MINLLPYDTVKELRAGQTNAHLLNFIVMLAVAVVFVACVTALAYIGLLAARNDAMERDTSAQQALAARSQDSKQIESFRKSLDDAEKITSVQARYSEIFIAIGKALPSNAVIKNLSVEPANINQGIDMTVYSKTKEAMTEIKNNMQANEEVFKDVSFSSVDFNTCDPSAQKYSCEAVVNVMLNDKVLYFGREEASS